MYYPVGELLQRVSLSRFLLFCFVTLSILFLLPGAFASTSFDMNSAASYALRMFGGNTTDNLGYTNSPGLGVQLVNVDGGSTNNDLLLTAVNADVNGLSDNGAVYLFRNIDTLEGSKDLNTGTYTARWFGGEASDNLGYTNSPGLGVQLVNVDGGSSGNDLVLTAASADVNGLVDNGAVYLVRDVNSISSGSDFNLGNSSSFGARWWGGKASDNLGRTNSSG
ncbi:MAG TPA: hypothetical protein VJG83_05810, partial [archaeon]|nr:hypothetical protein [archaeon]